MEWEKKKNMRMMCHISVRLLKYLKMSMYRRYIGVVSLRLGVQIPLDSIPLGISPSKKIPILVIPHGQFMTPKRCNKCAAHTGLVWVRVALGPIIRSFGEKKRKKKWGQCGTDILAIHLDIFIPRWEKQYNKSNLAYSTLLSFILKIVWPKKKYKEKN